MPDYIDRAGILFELETGFFPQDMEYTRAVEIAKSLIKSAPGVDAVEVVRCRDCEYYISDGGKYPYCEIMSNKGEGEYYHPFDDHYCSHGERRENG